MPGYTPGLDTPWEQTPPGTRHPSGADTPWSRNTPWEQTPLWEQIPTWSRPHPRADTPRSRHPRDQTPPRADTRPPPGSRHNPWGRHTRAVRILLECILVFVFNLRTIIYLSPSGIPTHCYTYCTPGISTAPYLPPLDTYCERYKL